MTETVIASTSVASGGGTVSGSFGCDPHEDVATLVINGDSNSSSIDVAATGGSRASSETIKKLPDGNSLTGIDATTDANNDVIVTFSGLKGLSRVEITVTNNGSSTTTIEVEETDY